jgi:hypothetical protein
MIPFRSPIPKASFGMGQTVNREPHVYTPAHDSCRSCIACGRPFEGYVDQPSTADRVRRDVLSIEWALPPKKEETACP